jgi:hypothetical protein
MHVLCLPRDGYGHHGKLMIEYGNSASASTPDAELVRTQTATV